MTDPRGDADRQVSNAFLVALLHYLERAGGPDLVDRVLAEAGCQKPLADLLRAKWGPRNEVLAVAAAARVVTGEPDLGRRAGEEMFRMTMADKATKAFFLSQGSPAAALAGVLEYTVHMGRGRTYRIVSSDHSGCVIEGDYQDRELGDPFFCGLSLGYWPMMATLFGAVGTALHPSCQCRGDDFCRFVIRWDPGASADRTAVEAADAELRRRIRTFEEMQSVAEELARAPDLPSLAERILDAVDGITPAPQLLVAIRAQPGRAPVVAARGMSARSARSMATGLLRGSYTARPGTMTAPVGSSGVVAAVAPDANSRSETSSRLLEAFARHAGARVEAVLSRQQAEESRQTAGALLQLARSLAETTTEEEVSDRLAQAIPILVGADHSSVLRWSSDTCTLRTVAFIGPEGRRPFQEFTVDQVPALCDLAARPAPFILERSKAAEYVALAMANWDEQLDVVVPLVEQGDLLGFVCAGYRGESGLDRGAAVARLQGAADLAAPAFTKARLLEEIRHQALHDDLTGLPNRVLLEDRVRQGLREVKRYGRQMGLLFLDLDRFKNVNDSMGHKFGDALIRAAAKRIGQSIRESDVFARMGGDEFVVMLCELSRPEDAGVVADKILADLRRPFDIEGQVLYMSASIGVATYPDDGDDFGTLLQAADSAMYAAKDAGRNTFSRRAPSATLAEGQRRLNLETALHRALERDEIKVLYQPQVAMADVKLVGVEALVRWDHPRLGELAPSDFLSIAEECGLMPRLDRLVRRKAFTQAAAWHQSFGPLVVAVNLSGQTICRPELLEEMTEDLDECGVHPALIEVELTEGMVADDDLVPVVVGLASMGVRVAIDDFGTGASVFSRLQRLPVHTLKIDRSLVQGHQTGRDSSILAAIIKMSHSLSLNVVAEGVEDPAQAGRLRRAGCDCGQGYLFGRPGPPAEIETIMYSQLTNLDRPAFSLRHGAGNRAAHPTA